MTFIFIDATEERAGELMRAGIPGRFAREILTGEFDPELGAAKAALRWREDLTSRLLILSGSTGTGKSLAASWLVASGARVTNAAPGESDIPQFVSWFDIIHSYFARDESRLLRLERSSPLAIDHVGLDLWEEQNKDAWRYFCDLLLRRLAKRLDTIVTTHLPAADFGKELLDDSSRQNLLSAATWLSCSGPSLRAAEKPPTGPKGLA